MSTRVVEMDTTCGLPLEASTYRQLMTRALSMMGQIQ